MNTTTVTEGEIKYVETLPGEQVLGSEADALDLVAACGEYETHRLMIHAEQISTDFFQLKSGLAGAVLLKFSNYGIRCAAVLTPEQVNQGRFQEFALETNRGNEFRIFYDRESAQKWLVRG
jgi:hypothetical protein